MNREIKFRAWTGFTMEYNIMAGFLGAFYVQGIDEKDSASMSPFNTKYSQDVPLMQYTGLKDKNGKEIYEGDIVRCASSTRCPHVVIWTEIQNQNMGSVPGWYLSGLNNPGYSFTGFEEVIGNIHENPELIPTR